MRWFIFYSCMRSYLCSIYSPSPFALCSDTTCHHLTFASASPLPLPHLCLHLPFASASSLPRLCLISASPLPHLRLTFASSPPRLHLASLSLHLTCDMSARPWDMLTKVEGGECAVGMVKLARARMWRGVWQSEGVQEEHEGVQGSVQGGVQGSVWRGVQGSAREHGEREEAWGSVRKHEGMRGSAGEHRWSARPCTDWLLWVLLDRLVFTLLLHTKINCYFINRYL